jgi:hypothetical protein
VSMTCSLYSRALRVWASKRLRHLERLKAASSHRPIAIAPERVAERPPKLTANQAAENAHLRRCAPMASLDVRTEYDCAQPVLRREVEGSILTRLASRRF